MEEDDR